MAGHFAITIACILALAGRHELARRHLPRFAALSLGFSTYDDSVGHFDSPAIEAVLIAFMLLAAINFATHFVAWRKKSLAAYLQDPGSRLLAVIAASIFVCAAYLSASAISELPCQPAPCRLQPGVDRNGLRLREPGLRQVAGIRAAVVPAAVMLVASSGSTGGGIKMIRALIWRQAGRQ